MSRILAIRELDARVPPLPPGLGNAIMEAFALAAFAEGRRAAQDLRGRHRARRAPGARSRRSTTWRTCGSRDHGVERGFPSSPAALTVPGC